MSSTIIDTDRKNILHDYTSTNYKLSLYMLAPVLAGNPTVDLAGLNTTNGFYLLAQSGGSKPEDRVPPLQLPENGKRTRFEGLEFFIDDLSMTTGVNASGTGDNSMPFSFGFRFVITEPIGTSFLVMLKDSHEAITKLWQLKGVASSENTFLQQPYGLKIAFNGYDGAGNLHQEFFQAFYLLKILKIKFKFDGKSPKYEIEAGSFSCTQATDNTSTIKKPITIKGHTFEQVVDDLKQKLTQREIDVKDQLTEQNQT